MKVKGGLQETLLLRAQNSKVIPSLFELDINLSQACSIYTYLLYRISARAREIVMAPVPGTTPRTAGATSPRMSMAERWRPRLLVQTQSEVLSTPKGEFLRVINYNLSRPRKTPNYVF